MTSKESNKNWYLYDADGEVLGRISTKIADSLRGKLSTDFAKNKDNGNIVVVINAEKVKVTGKKEDQKVYYKHTGYIGNLKKSTFKQMREYHPEEIIKKAVYGMIPKNKLRDTIVSRLKIYSGPSHPHQNVKFVNIKTK